MLIPHVVQTEADKVFINIYNSQVAVIADGTPVAWNVSSPDGVKTTQPVTVTLSLLCGIADGAIAASAYGLAQAYGYKATVLVTGDSATTVAAGAILEPVNGADRLIYSAASNGVSGLVMAGEAVATSGAAAAVKCFIRCL